MEIAVAQVFFLYVVVFVKKPEIVASPCRKTRSMRFCSGGATGQNVVNRLTVFTAVYDSFQGCACLTQPLHAIENVQFYWGTFKLSFEKGYNGRSHQKRCKIGGSPSISFWCKSKLSASFNTINLQDVRAH